MGITPGRHGHSHGREQYRDQGSQVQKAAGPVHCPTNLGTGVLDVSQIFARLENTTQFRLEVIHRTLFACEQHPVSDAAAWLDQACAFQVKLVDQQSRRQVDEAPALIRAKIQHPAQGKARCTNFDHRACIHAEPGQQSW